MSPDEMLLEEIKAMMAEIETNIQRTLAATEQIIQVTNEILAADDGTHESISAIMLGNG